MIVTEQRNIEKILASVKEYSKLFLIGCGECATTCKTGGKEEVAALEAALKKHGKEIVGTCVPDAPCVAAQIKSAMAKNMQALKDAEAVLVLACGLGVQSVKLNNRLALPAIPVCNTKFGAIVDSQGNLYERCSLCGECVLDITGDICPITLCSKSLLNGPCGGMNKGKCETDPQKDCAWVLIYKELEARKKVHTLKQIQPPKDFKKAAKPHKLIVK